MAIVPKYDPAVIASRASRAALGRALQDFNQALIKRIHEKTGDGTIPDWWDVNNIAAMQTMHDNLCALETKTRLNLLDISGLSLILLNFVDESTLIEDGP